MSALLMGEQELLPQITDWFSEYDPPFKLYRDPEQSGYGWIGQDIAYELPPPNWGSDFADPSIPYEAHLFPIAISLETAEKVLKELNHQ